MSQESKLQITKLHDDNIKLQNEIIESQKELDDCRNEMNNLRANIRELEAEREEQFELIESLKGNIYFIFCKY